MDRRNALWGWGVSMQYAGEFYLLAKKLIDSARKNNAQ